MFTQKTRVMTKRCLMKILKILFSSLVVIIFNNILVNAAPITFTQGVSLPPPIPYGLYESEPLFLDVDFGTEFTSISEFTFTATFQGDNWVIGETIGVFFPGPFVYIGIAATANNLSDPNKYQLTTSTWQEPINALMDGKTDFYIEMLNGSVDLQSVRLELNATPVPEPSTITFFTTGFGAILLMHRRINKNRQS